MADNTFEIKLRNACGVPVLQIGGQFTRTALSAVKFTIERLASAGHYHVILNVEKAEAASWDFLTGLAGAVDRIRKHYGTVDLVATQERLNQLVGTDKIAKLFRLCGSEGQAISRIKKLDRQPDGVVQTNARLVEKQ